jgi:hypothetical protein
MLIKGRGKVTVLDSEGRITEDRPWKSNTFVLSGKELIAALMKGDLTIINGVMYHAFGEGDASWDTLSEPPEVDFTESSFLSEIPASRKFPDGIAYLDDLGGVSATPTSVIEATTTLLTTDLPPSGVYIREHGLFGGNATATENTGYMIDKINERRIWKDSSNSIIFRIRIEF